MAQVNYYYPTIAYEQELEKRKELFIHSEKTGLDESTGIKCSRAFADFRTYRHETIPNDFDMSKYELVYSETDNTINSIDDFEKQAQANNCSIKQYIIDQVRRDFNNGDIVEINELRYYCLTTGWKQV